MTNFLADFFLQWFWHRSDAKFEVKGPSGAIKEHKTGQDLVWCANLCFSWLSVFYWTIFWSTPLASCWCSVKPAQPSLDYFGFTIENLCLSCPGENCGRWKSATSADENLWLMKTVAGLSGKWGQNMNNWIVSELCPRPFCFVISVSTKYPNRYSHLRLPESLDPMIMAINEPGFTERKTLSNLNQ